MRTVATGVATEISDRDERKTDRAVTAIIEREIEDPLVKALLHEHHELVKAENRRVSASTSSL